MTQLIYVAAQKPTTYFIGVTTSKSSIMKVFPDWANYCNWGTPDKRNGFQMA